MLLRIIYTKLADCLLLKEKNTHSLLTRTYVRIRIQTHTCVQSFEAVGVEFLFKFLFFIQFLLLLSALCILKCITKHGQAVA